jgi:transcriptional regulator with XRE-family HTH domain
MTDHILPGRAPSSPGARLRALRVERGWTLADVSKRTGMTISALSKVEIGKVALTYDKLVRLSEGLDIDLSTLLSGPADASEATRGLGRRSVARAGEGMVIATQNYDHIYPAADILNKGLIPIVVELRARSIEAFGQLVRHSGEEYTFVLEGAAELYTSLYKPLRLEVGDSVYLDSTMDHGYIAAAPGACRVLCICTGSERQILNAFRGDRAA